MYSKFIFCVWTMLIVENPKSTKSKIPILKNFPLLEEYQKINSKGTRKGS